MKKSHAIQLLIVFILFMNILLLDFSQLSNYGVNKLNFINIMAIIFLLVFYLLEEGDKKKKEQAAAQNRKSGKAFGTRKNLDK